MSFGQLFHRGVVVAALAGSLGCGSRAAVTPAVHGSPPVSEFLARVEYDPVGAAPLARAIVRSSDVDETTRRRVISRWSAEVPRLEYLRDARLADAEALLAQGALGAATEALSESAALEAAVGLPGHPRSVSQLARDLEWARLAAEQTAREAGERARGAYRNGQFEAALNAASEARQLRARAGLPSDVGLSVLEGLAGRALPSRTASPPAPVAVSARAPSVRAAPRRGVAVIPPRRVTPEPTEVPRAPAPDPLAAVRHAWHADDLPGALRALDRARTAGADAPDFADLTARIEGRRDAVIKAALESAAAAYAREDLEAARAHWERVLVLMPGEPTASEGLSLYRRFVGLQPGANR